MKKKIFALLLMVSIAYGKVGDIGGGMLLPYDNIEGFVINGEYIGMEEFLDGHIDLDRIDVTDDKINFWPTEWPDGFSVIFDDENEKVIIEARDGAGDMGGGNP